MQNGKLLIKFYTAVILVMVNSMSLANNFIDDTQKAIESLVKKKQVVNLVAYIQDGDQEKFISLGKNNYSFDKPFPLCSLSKVYLGTLFYKLEKEGLVSSTDSISIENQEISYKKILSHTSGLADNIKNISNSSDPFADIDKTTFHNNLDHSSEDVGKFIYSNQGPVLIDEYIQRKLNLTYNQYINKYLERPIGIKLNYDHAELPIGHTSWFNKQNVWKLNHSVAAGGLSSTIKDSATFAKYILNKFSNGFPSQYSADDFEIGYFWGMINNKKVLTHAGRMYGHSSFLGIDLDKKRVISILSDTDYDLNSFLNLFENKKVTINGDFFIKSFFKKYNLKD